MTRRIRGNREDMMGEANDAAGGAPPRGTRPRNRRALILAAAADLFARDGYPRVGMGEIAEAVNMSPAALYRHFAGKQELLRETIRAAVEHGLRILSAGLEHGPGPVSDAVFERLLADLAAGALEQRRLGVLWQRESRHLPASERAELRESLRTAMVALRTVLQARRPDLTADQAELLAWCTFGVLISVSYQHVELPRAEYERLLADMVRSVVDAPIGPVTQVRGLGPRAQPAYGLRSRREMLLAAATRMFAEHGYAAVGIEDIAAAVGIAGPSIYNHFSNKAEILTSVLSRGDEAMRMDLVRALGGADSPMDALRRALHGYTAIALDHSDLIQVMVAELAHLPELELARARGVQRDFINEWVLLLCDAHPGLDRSPARVRVQAVFTVVNDIACTPHLHRAQGVAEGLQAVGGALLGVGATG
jgi:AcrR family transcriptional regulator